MIMSFKQYTALTCTRDGTQKQQQYRAYSISYDRGGSRTHLVEAVHLTRTCTGRELRALHSYQRACKPMDAVPPSPPTERMRKQ